jgi:histidinol phosphatase-like PHP family hydrolase
MSSDAAAIAGRSRFVPIYNLHNHTPFSDGAYSVDEICDAHLALAELTVDGVGISDHLFRTPSSRECGDDREFERVFAGETRRYVEHVHAARRRWAGRMRIVCGCEINWPLNRKHVDVIRTMLAGVDYVLFENVDWAGLTQLANQSRRFPCPIGLAHTRVSEQMPTTSLDQVVRTLANARIFYEVNSKFLPLAERDPWFAILSQHRVHISLGTDTHDDLAVVRTLPALAAYVERHGLSERALQLKQFEPALVPQPA